MSPLLTRRRLAVAAIVIVALAAAGGFIAWRLLLAGSYDGEAKWLYISRDATPESIAATLTDSLGATGSRAARIWRLEGADPARAHGAYLIEPGITPLHLYRKISRGMQTPVKLTFNNVRTMEQLADRVSGRLDMTAAEFLEACDSVLPQRGFTRAAYPAAFLPDSYEFYWTASPKKVVTALADTRDRFWNDTRRAKARALGLTPVEVATVASIAEEETNNAAERGTVARLYINRVQRKMPLQADPTVKFAAGDFNLRRITKSHLDTKSPYNTYLNTGLPPGPIRIADARTLDATLDSKPHNYLYMCAKEDFSGLHNFAADYATHQRNAARYHAALNKRGIK